jgi:hypothetical protein
MALSNSKTLKTSVLSVTALAASSAWGKSGLGGGGLGVDFLTLDELPIKNATICSMPDENNANNTNEFTGLSSDNPWIVTDGSEGKSVKVSFVVSEMTATDEDRVLFLVYSPRKSPSPSILTTDKGPELGVELSEMEILGFYQIPALYRSRQEKTKVGLADANPTTKMTVHVIFDQNKLDEMIRLGKETIYVQAGLLRVVDLQAGLYENMILSEMDSLTFVANECPAETVESYEADEQGNVGKSPPKLPTL